MRSKPIVERGQVWEDCDKRMQGRKIHIVDVDEDYAYSVDIDAQGRPLMRGPQHRILVRRMYPHSTGFKLVEETPDG